MKLARQITLGSGPNAKTIDIPVTMLDRVVATFNPVAGLSRYRARVQMAMAGAYTAADRTRRANQHGSRREMDADSAILPDLQTLREESQHMLRNSPLAAGAIKTNVTRVVGTGLKVKSQIDRDILGLSVEQAQAWERAAEREFRLATANREIDAERQLNFAGLQALAFLKVLEDGDVLANLPYLKRAGSPYGLKVQLIEAARVVNKGMAPNTDRLVAGVVKDASGAPVAYHVCNQHPGRTGFYRHRDKASWTVLPAFGKRTGAPLAWLLLDKTRPGQTRGVPYLAPVVEIIKQLGRYTDAEVMAAVVSGMLTAFVTSEAGNASFGPAPNLDNPTGDASQQADTTGLELGYGSVVGLLPGEKVETVNPGRPNPEFGPFMDAMAEQIGVALELPKELLVKHFTASYSAARAALLEAWAYFNRRRTWLADNFCQPVYEAIITEAVATGRLEAPGYFSDPLIRQAWLGTVWTGDAQGELDPVKAAKAASIRLNEAFLTTHDEEAIAHNGTDFEAKLPRIIRNRKALAAAGLQPLEVTTEATPDNGGSDLET